MKHPALLLLPLLLGGCTPTTAAMSQTQPGALAGTMTVRLDRQHPKAELPAAGLAFELRHIVDSRCPVNVQCVWAGDAAVYFTVKMLGKPASELELHTGLAPKRVSVGGYSLAIGEVFPTPRGAELGGDVVQSVVLEVRAEGK
ncbi:hypothetical protein [Deinococcus sp.]|uniref:hypothetical protein n=1 Tax=Deinococcus sp. TaxID=47478 RepID=UPI0025E5BE44|nr:hypothetical protein [Deinococcus sp.]